MNRLTQTIIIIILVFAIPDNTVWAKDEAEINFIKAEKLVTSQKYSEALSLYLSVLETYPENEKTNFRIGQCYMNLLGQERNALPYLKKAVEKIDPEFKQGEFSESGSSPKSWLLLGDAYNRDEQPKLASEAYHNYLEYTKNDKKEMDLVNDRIMGLGVAKRQEQLHANNVVLTNVGDKINSKYSEYNIVYSGDEKTMVFSRYQKKSDIIFASYYKDGGWTDPIDISEQIGSAGDMYATALSYDGTELFLILLTAFDADIYVSEFSNGKWQYAENIGRSINSKYVESNACVSSDGNTLYFSSDRASGVGGFDIFSSQRVDGKWEKAVNIGETINSKDNEESPFITEDGKLLYFSSDRKGSIGRMDIYFSKKDADLGWGEPENMGMPYNSVEDDISFKYYGKYRKGYIARDLPGGLGKLDIYLLQSGEDRQRELQDYMASLAPDPPVEESIADEQAESIETEDPTSPELTSPVAVPAGTAAIIAAAEVSKEQKLVEPEPIEENVIEDTDNGSVTSEPVQEVIVSEDKPVIKAAEPTVETSAQDKIEETVQQNPKHEKITFEGDYTIQFLALIFPKRQTSYKGLNSDMVRRVEGSDGYTRYIYGQYSSREEAINDLNMVFKHGYSDAFIRIIPQ